MGAGCWDGFLMDGSNSCSEIKLHREFFTSDNICALLRKHGAPLDLALLVVDTDLYDYWILEAIFECGWRPKLFVTEFNSNLGPKVPWTVPRKANLTFHDDTDFFGASLMAFGKLAAGYGYVLLYVEA